MDPNFNISYVWEVLKFGFSDLNSVVSLCPLLSSSHSHTIVFKTYATYPIQVARGKEYSH
ncbi:rCG63387 [Rattus norvegicus]|uniref:RCG63387 n=1 Tax=Rattus norvegicus TaxID=10116 RepID=A6JF30_RAT|nr:rCG63387 [Rattus norvegicus]